MLAATLDGAPVECSSEETAKFDAPPGQTCQEYAGAFAKTAGGYLLNPDATSACEFCPISSGNDYLASLNIKASDKWRGKLDTTDPFFLLPCTNIHHRFWHLPCFLCVKLDARILLYLHSPRSGLELWLRESVWRIGQVG
jgi:hypothetical protein